MDNSFIKVLLIEDDLRFARGLRESLCALTAARIQLVILQTLQEALHGVTEGHFDAILADLSLSDSQGIDTFSRLHARVPTAPIIILAGCDNESLALEAVRQGAQDYLVRTKFEGRMLSRVIRYAIERKRVERRLTAQYVVASVLAESESLTDASSAILRAIGENLEWELGGLWEVDNAAEKLRCVSVWHRPRAHNTEFESVTRGHEFSKGSDLPGRVWASGFNAVIERSLWLVNYELNRARISVTRDLAADLPPVRVDRAKMEQVLINLFMNAIQAMPEGGTLSIKTSVARFGEIQHAAGQMLCPLAPQDAVVLAEIRDTGVGIPQEKLPRIFEPFFTTKPGGIGTGLGLPVTKQIIDLHGGAIEIAPGSDGGVRVWVVLKAEANDRAVTASNPKYERALL